MNKLREVVEGRGWRVSLREKSRFDRVLAGAGRAYHLHEIDGASGARGLNYRRAYFYPWWMFDHPNQRFGGRIGAMSFDAASIDGRVATAFYAGLKRNYLADWARGDPNGPALVPLQAELTRQRPWQFMDLKTLVSLIRQHDPAREIILKPHPKLTYSAKEQALLAELVTNPQTRISEAPMKEAMGGCAYIATQNSAAAFEAMVLGIPALICARADFHHGCTVLRPDADAASAFARLRGEKPDFARYLYWFLEKNCVHAGRDDAHRKIAALLAECGWPVGPIA
ncbi:MAG: hypothetical protein WD046_11005 [Paracoccaceae bacterium]